MSRTEAAGRLAVDAVDVWLIREVGDGHVVSVHDDVGMVATRILSNGKVGRRHRLGLDGFWRERFKAS